MTIEIPKWPFVFGSPACSGKIRAVPEDFIVYENLAFEPSGVGEHVFLQIQKTEENTEFVARKLARFANVRQRDIGYAGLKDRHAVTTQWFSVWLPGKSDPDWAAFETSGIKILQALRHNKKLKRGVLSGNHFVLTIRDCQGDYGRCFEQLKQIKSNGLANYYGEQRFGINGQNLNKALLMFHGVKAERELRSLYLSATRSFLFNQILSLRVVDYTWNQAVKGDAFMFDGSQGYFKSQAVDTDILRRLTEKKIHPSGVLWGKGENAVSGDAYAVEQQVIDANPELAQGLIQNGVDQSRRPLRINVNDLEWTFKDDMTLKLKFTLPAGSYATALLRELIYY
jgi:tRNA pseudouridine13 synthase